MVKKGLLGVGLGALALGLVFGHKAPSYVMTAFHKVRHSAERAVPIQFDIDRARQELDALEPAIRENVENLARAEEDVKELDQEITAFRTNLDREKREMLALRRELGDGSVLRTNTSFSAEDVKKDLIGRLDHCRQSQKTLAEMEKTLKLRKQAVVSAKQQLDGFVQQKRSLETQIDEIEARQRAIEAARTTDEFRFDDTRLGRVKQTIKELRRRQNIMVNAAELHGRYIDKQVPVGTEPVRDVLKEIDSEYGAPASASDKVTDKDL
jgi:chromosome segregation ATPase